MAKQRCLGLEDADFADLFRKIDEETELSQICVGYHNHGGCRASLCIRPAPKNEDHAGASVPSPKTKPLVQPERHGGDC